ncbi:hypothetical protein DID88_002427 [Monilinia fructigena]|uniref:J domain-containing protein n=1 Tax=Monilinia fructigena TaxID=38457 RepID=A0A395IQQ6_9HELO|nr:hypothetical protein DID88_002427 [Monilinia fructigena]
MIVKVKLSALAFAATLLSSNSLCVSALSAADIPSDTPISSLLASANAHLAKGETNDALTYYDIAIARDPSNYLSHFRRGAAYLSLGRMAQAAQDFDKVLTIKPGHEPALSQRAKIRAKSGDWEAAKQDYLTLGSAQGAEEELERLVEAQGAASLATDAEKSQNWEECVTQAGAAIMVASKVEGMSDLKHVLQMQPGLTDPHLQISTINFYNLGELEQGMDQLRKCLHSDPDSKSCKKLYRREKTIDKTLAQVQKHFDKHQYSSGVKLLVPSGEEVGLVQEIKDDIKESRESGIIPEHAPNHLVTRLVELVCQAYHETKNTHFMDFSTKAQRHIEAENYEAAINALNTAKENHPDANQIGGLLQNAHVELKRSKTKDYYKILGVPKDADELQIKAAYRRSIKLNHPDKAHKQGVTKEAAEKKMAAINEAYEVLSDPELKARFDQGEMIRMITSNKEATHSKEVAHLVVVVSLSNMVDTMAVVSNLTSSFGQGGSTSAKKKFRFEAIKYLLYDLSFGFDQLTMDEFEVAYTLDNEQQFWDEIDDIVSAKCASYQLIDNALRSYLHFTTNFKEEYLQSEFEVAKCLQKLMQSELFATNKDYVRTQIVYSLMQEDVPATLHVISSFLLFDGRNNEITFEIMNKEGCFPRLLELVKKGNREDPTLHRLLLELLYEMSRMQRLSFEDLGQVDDEFISFLFQIIEELSDDVDDPYHYPVIRVLVVLNEQYMVASTSNWIPHIT